MSVNHVAMMRAVNYFEQLVHHVVSSPVEGIDMNEMLREFNTLKTEIQKLNAQNAPPEDL